MTELDAERVGEAVVRRHLPLVIDLDPLLGEIERVERAAVAGGVRRIHLGRGHPQALGVDRNAVEFVGQLDQRLIAAGDHVGNDGADGRLDISGGLALGVEEGAEPLGEIGGLGVETDGHAPS